jgi:tripartite-type tricarboxylate transporter receptor subunit TctC
MGTVGVGSPSEVAARLFQQRTGTSFQIIPYRGGAPVVEDMLGGHIDFAFGQRRAI